MEKLFLSMCISLLLTSSLNAQCLSLDTVWTKLYNGSANSTDRMNDIKVNNTTGNIFVTGESLGSGGVGADYMTIKYNSLGDTLWTKRYNGPADAGDVANAVVIDEFENVYVTGESVGTGGAGKDIVTIKYNSDGVQQWLQRYNGSANNNDVGYSIYLDAAGFIYVTGSASVSGNGNDFVTIKYNSGGNNIWTSNYHSGSATDIAAKVIVDNSGNVFVTGRSIGSGGTNLDYATVKYNSSGIQLWVKRYNGLGNNDDEPFDITLDNNGFVYVTGSSLNVGGGNSDFLTIKYDPVNGDSLLVKRYDSGTTPGPGKDEANSIHVDTAGNIYVTGRSDSLSTDGYDYLTIKYDPSGNILWQNRYDGPAHGNDEACSILPGQNGKVYVAGISYGTGTRKDIVIVEYDEVTGNQCYFVRTSIDNSGDEIYKMAIDYQRHSLYVCGETTGGGGGYDGMTVRFKVVSIINVRVVFEGYYNIFSNSMITGDTVRAYLRNLSSPYDIQDSAAAYIDQGTFNGSFVYRDAAPGTYYIALKHRNTIETWSKSSGVFLPFGSLISYNFTNLQSQAFGNNMKRVDTSPLRFGVYSGDVNQDGVIDGSDTQLIDNDAQDFETGYLSTDLNGDEAIDGSDALIGENNAVNFVAVILP